jgi:hypothetical protein
LIAQRGKLGGRGLAGLIAQRGKLGGSGLAAPELVAVEIGDSLVVKPTPVVKLIGVVDTRKPGSSGFVPLVTVGQFGEWRPRQNH